MDSRSNDQLLDLYRVSEGWHPNRLSHSLSQLEEMDVHVYFGTTSARFQPVELGVGLIVRSFTVVRPVDLNDNQIATGTGCCCGRHAVGVVENPSPTKRRTRCFKTRRFSAPVTGSFDGLEEVFRCDKTTMELRSICVVKEPT